MEYDTKMINEKLAKLSRDVEIIKEMMIVQKESGEMEEIELTDWAKAELEEARKRPHSEKISHEEVKRMILEK